jgi:hypothetical protein
MEEVMTKTEIIEKTLRELQPFDQDEEEFIMSVLRDARPEGVSIRTCEDFRHL